MDKLDGFPRPESSPILVVGGGDSQTEQPLALLQHLGYPVRATGSARAALDAIGSFQPSLLLLDLDIADGAGPNIARSALERDPSLAIVTLSGPHNVAQIVECFRLGLSDCLIRPWSANQLAGSIRRALHRRAEEIYRHESALALKRELTARDEQLREAAGDVLRDVADTLEEKHPYLKGHGKRVADLSAVIAKEVGLPAATVVDVWWAGRLHDVGMIIVPDEALGSNDSLTADQAQKVRSHPALGAKLARGYGLETVADYIQAHHERVDGSGYPNALRESEIPLGAMIVGLAESFAAITEARPHRDSCSPLEALEILRGAEGVWYSRKLINATAAAVKKKVG